MRIAHGNYDRDELKQLLNRSNDLIEESRKPDADEQVQVALLRETLKTLEIVLENDHHFVIQNKEMVQQMKDHVKAIQSLLNKR